MTAAPLVPLLGAPTAITAPEMATDSPNAAPNSGTGSLRLASRFQIVALARLNTLAKPEALMYGQPTTAREPDTATAWPKLYPPKLRAGPGRVAGLDQVVPCLLNTMTCPARFWPGAPTTAVEPEIPTDAPKLPFLCGFFALSTPRRCQLMPPSRT